MASKKPESKRATKSAKGSIWVAQVPLAYEVLAAGHTRQEAVDAAAKFAARWLKDRGAEEHEDGPWTAERVKDYFGVNATLVPIGGATI
jgi:predicted RNase H-like HicB family nuclease